MTLADCIYIISGTAIVVTIVVSFINMSNKITELEIDLRVAKRSSIKYQCLKNLLFSLEVPPRVCRVCATIGGKHNVTCPYMIVSDALYRVENYI